MGVSALFKSFTFKKSLPGIFSNPGVVKQRNDVVSKFNTTTPSQSVLHGPTLNAVMKYISLNIEPIDCAMGVQGDFILVEWAATLQERHVVVYNIVTGKVFASVFETPESSPTTYTISEKKHDGSAILFALLGNIINENELNYQMQSLARLEELTNDDEDYSKAGAVICDNIRRRIELNDKLGDDGIKVLIPETGNLQGISVLQLNKGVYSPETVVSGEFLILKPNSVKKASTVKMTATELKENFKLSERTFSYDETLLIPNIPSWYIVPKEVVHVCQHAQATTTSSLPMRNFMFRGPSGTGKTEGAKAVASAMGLPYVHVTCSANSEIYDLLGQMLPVFEDDKKENNYELPTFEDIQMDVSTAFCKMTGIYDEKVTETDVYNKLIDIISQKAKEESAVPSENKQQFKYVDTPLVKAFKYGYCCELQEPSVIANPGVLVGLNALLDNCKSITLPTGEQVFRHPDTVIIITTNNDYNGCREMNQSVLSRMNLIIDMEEPDTGTLIKRVTAITGFNDEDLLLQMAKVVADIQKRCKEAMISDGCCGVRELINWVQSYQITADILGSAQYTVLSSVSSDPESREEILNTCIKPMFE